MRIRYYTLQRRHQPWPKIKNVPLRSKYRTYEASNLVLDLDAEHNDYVRPYNEDVDGALAPDWSHEVRELRPIQARIADFEKQSQDYEEHFRTTAADKFGSWRILDYDILSVALDNLSMRETAGRPSIDINRHVDQVTNSILEENGIPHFVRNSPSKTIAYMLRRQRLAQRLQPEVGDEGSLEEALGNCHSFFGIERLVTNVIQTPQGCQLVSACTDALERVCANLAGTASPAEILSFLNNLIINLDSQGLYVSPSLLTRAYVASLQCCAFTTAQKYMKILRGKTEFNETQVLESLELLSTAASLPGGIRLRIDHLLASYSLLTGRVLGEDAAPQPSLQDLIFKCGPHAFRQYLTCLARLGAFRTMWYMWHTQSKSAEDYATSNRREGLSPSVSIGAARMATDPDARLDFIKAMNFAIAIREAFSVNSRFAEISQAPEFARVAGQYDEDCQLDMAAMIKSADILSTRDRGGTHRFETDEMRGIFGKESVQEAMLALQSYLSRVQLPSHDGISRPREINDGISSPRGINSRGFPLREISDAKSEHVPRYNWGRDRG
ncbi:hypothetical protein F4677DRAFT_412771 [Hypoxylon crocopeplum]|nr:hypothetical protein F4677DRAFT_412771 [Hypoxylon crocopeplum]